jgi:hypothetical protein
MTSMLKVLYDLAAISRPANRYNSDFVASKGEPMNDFGLCTELRARNDAYASHSSNITI